LLVPEPGIEDDTYVIRAFLRWHFQMWTIMGGIMGGTKFQWNMSVMKLIVFLLKIICRSVYQMA